MTGKVVSIITARVPKELWKNSRDSIFHALEHFSELSLKYGDERHHKKWIVLSVHHAAETFCNMLLKQFDPGNAIFKRKGQDYWPSLVPAIDELLTPKFRARLTGAEIRLLDLLKELNESRNRIMHGMVPQDLDLTLPAMSILGLSRVAYRRRGESVEDILQVDPPIQGDVVQAISYRKSQDYYRFVEAFQQAYKRETFLEHGNRHHDVFASYQLLGLEVALVVAIDPALERVHPAHTLLSLEVAGATGQGLAE